MYPSDAGLSSHCPTERRSPQPETHWFVFDGGTGYTQVELAILLDAGINQSLNRGLFLEEQEGVACEEETGLLDTNIGCTLPGSASSLV